METNQNFLAFLANFWPQTLCIYNKNQFYFVCTWKLFPKRNHRTFEENKDINQCPNVSTTPIMAMGCQQCLLLSVVQQKGKHYRKPHCRNGVVDTFGHWFVRKCAVLRVERLLQPSDFSTALLVGLALGLGSVSRFYNRNIHIIKFIWFFFSVLMLTMEVAQELAIIWKDPHRDWYSSICHKEGSHFYTSQILTLKYRQNLCQEILQLHRKQGKTIFY